MYTNISTTIISLFLLFVFLPPLATAEGPIWYPPTWPPNLKQPYYWGDVLNITKCYCLGLHDDDHNKGYYYQFDYRNFHNELTYRVNLTCDSDANTLVRQDNKPERIEYLVPDCWNTHSASRTEKIKECVEDVQFADTFCFELGDEKHPHDYYYFDGEKRGLPDFGIVEHETDQCVDLCRDKVGGKVIASDVEKERKKYLPDLNQHVPIPKNSFQTYTNLDDVIPNFTAKCETNC